METPQWLFGPSGDLQPLPYPEPGIGNTVERFGGIHQAINGARTVDTFGFRAGYEFELEYLEPEEYFRLEALYTETIPGPFWLVDPMRKNLLSREAALGKPAGVSGRGVTAGNFSSGKWVRVTDSPLSWNQRAFEWVNFDQSSTGADVRFDGKLRFPVLDSTPTSVSVYVKPTAAISLGFSLYNFDADGVELSPVHQPYAAVPADTWTRHSYSYQPADLPAGTVESRLGMWYQPDSGAIDGTTALLMNPQVEHSDTITTPALGGAAVRVVINTMDATSPRYPYQSATLSLLEV